MKKGILVALVLSASAAAGAGAWYKFIYEDTSTKSSTAKDAVFVNPVSEIVGMDAMTGTMTRFAGVVEPQRTWSAKLANEKTVAETYVKVGDEVKEGDKLFSYNTAEDEDKLAQDEIDLEREQNELENAKTALANLEKSKPTDNSADAQLAYQTNILQQQNEIKQHEYEIKSKQLEIDNLKETVKNATVHSELNGVVKSVADSSSGDSNSSAYITIMEVGAYRVKGTLNEQNKSALSTGMSMIIYSRADDTTYWTGAISEIKYDTGKSNAQDDGYGDENDNTNTNSTDYPFYVSVDDPEGLMLGQHVYMEVDNGQLQKKSGLYLPDYYVVLEDDGSAYVWAESTKGKLEKRTVTLGEHDENAFAYEIKAGLSADDYITTPDGTPNLKEGLPVTEIAYNGGYVDDMGSALYEDYEDFGSTYYEDYEDMGSVYYEDVFGSVYSEDDFGSVYYEDDFGSVAEEDAVSMDSVSKEG